MTVSSTAYLQRITTSGQTNPSWTIDFPVFDEKDIWVWKVSIPSGIHEKLNLGEHYTVSIDGSTGTLNYIGTTDNALTSHLRVQRQIERVQQDDFRTGDRNATIEAYENTLDKLAMMNQQAMQIDPKQRKDWTAGHEYADDAFWKDRVTGVDNGTDAHDAVNKSQVDTALGGGTNPPTIASVDVGQWATANSSNSYSWEDFSGTDDPKGNQGKHLTVGGWRDISAYLPPITGSGDNDKVLMDIDGVPTWTAVNEFQTSFDDSPSQKYKKPYTIITHSSSRKVSVRDYAAGEKLLPNLQGRHLTAVETGYSTAENKLEFGRGFCITEHTVTCRKRPTAGGKGATENWYSGMKEDSDHPVYLGTVSNIYDSTSVVPFFTSKHEITPNDEGNGPTATRWFNFNGSQAATPGWQNDFSGIEQSSARFGWWFNVVSITTSTITFVASSMLHENCARINLQTPAEPEEVYRVIKHPEEADISFNILWYQQKT